MFFFMIEIQGAILSQNQRRSQGRGTGGPDPSIEMLPMTEM